jgi:hypothetical protein
MRTYFVHIDDPRFKIIDYESFEINNTLWIKPIYKEDFKMETKELALLRKASELIDELLNRVSVLKFFLLIPRVNELREEIDECITDNNES